MVAIREEVEHEIWWQVEAVNSKYETNPKVKHIMKTLPAIIMWELWKRRNAKRHDNEVSYDKMYTQCPSTVHMLIRAKYPWLRAIPYDWLGMFDLLQQYKPNLYYHICNTDGASKGNLEESSYGFCIRGRQGDLVYAEAQSIGNTTNMEAEITAIWKALSYCKRCRITKVILETDSLSLKNMIQ
ncbi:hypothetical protein R3W88_021460 [Solanum pinnatisectum]|uniref:RNase H type-1 domain-containing protein n=1 Tax=Solanum pinnatisectum TaxID=50273 RepID=A0AAV9LVT4_9SOLN|nr:hypothetical protein R3W88_021460 [Solanum pinnatisectum]